MNAKEPSLPKKLQPALRALEKDLLVRAKLPSVEAGLLAAHDAERKAGETGMGFEPWRRDKVTQIAAAWILSLVFVRTLEDRRLIDPRVAGPTAAALAAARDRGQTTFAQLAPFLGPREYLLAVFRELSQLPGARHVFDARHNPVWVLAPSSEGARALLDFFQKPDSASGAPVLTFPGTDTSFLGNLYQDLSEAARKRYALLQTPDFVEKFILDQTLAPAIAEFGLGEVRLIDPTCGSGHFLLGAFRDLLAAWRDREPMQPVEELARRALRQVHGVDINPYAVAIARFRLVLAVLDAVGITRLDKAPDVRPKVAVADSLLHRLQEEQLRLSGELPFEQARTWGDDLFRLEDPHEVKEVLGQRYHAVVGNPPYISEKDPTKRKEYRKQYVSASGKFALAAPFTERFFDLATSNGFVGMINSNAWTKRDYGKALIEQTLPRVELQKVIDTAGCYLPGHGTPTLLLFGRNRAPGASAVRSVLGKRGERKIPDEAASAPVWSEILAHHDTDGFEGTHISVEHFTRAEAATHPWILTGGGARPFLRAVLLPRARPLREIAESVGVMAVTGEDSVFPQVHAVHARQRVQPTIQLVEGDEIGDWASNPRLSVPWMYGDDQAVLDATIIPSIIRFLWPSKCLISRRKRFGVPMLDRGYAWYELQEVYFSKLKTNLAISFSLVTTHFRPSLFRERTLFKNSAPIIKLHPRYSEPDYQGLLGYLNSSTTAFWCRLVMFPKGGDQVGDGARLSKTPWQDRLEYAGNLLQQLPVPALDRLRDALLDVVIAAEDTTRQLGECAPDRSVAAALAEYPTLTALRAARDHMVAERARLRAILVSLQEEIDWRVYGLFGLPTITAPTVAAVRVPVLPNHRPFEVRLAREVATDISASEWFRLHRRDAPISVGGPLADLYQQRLRLIDDPVRGKELRLLETPETKRRWSPVDDTAAFTDSARTWLLERVEAAFRGQDTPALRTARQLALDLGRDVALQAVAELLAETDGFDLQRRVADLVDAQGVPYLAAHRYSETGLEKRVQWEETWRLQRLEDAGTLAPELKRLGLDAISVPDKYARGDFQQHYWGLRGALDVPKERFITVPGGNGDEDPTPVVGWAGWDHLQTAQAMSALYQRRKVEDGWTKERLIPLLAGIAERVPWLLQWHDAPSEAFGGMRLGQFFRDFVGGEAHSLGVSVAELAAWKPMTVVARTSVEPEEVLAALVAWKPEESEDGDEDDEPVEGATPGELASEVGVKKALIAKALKILVNEGLVEQTSAKPARYKALGGDS